MREKKNEKTDDAQIRQQKAHSNCVELDHSRSKNMFPPQERSEEGNPRAELLAVVSVVVVVVIILL